MRASQLDAARLDNELTAMLREQFMRIFSLFQPVSSCCGLHPLHIQSLTLRCQLLSSPLVQTFVSLRRG